jgi:hypothetical protein
METMKILVLLDGSMWSHKGALYALRIAREKKAEVVLFSVLDKRDSKSMAFNFCTQSNMCSRIENYESQIWRDMRKNINDEMAQVLLFFNREKNFDHIKDCRRVGIGRDHQRGGKRWIRPDCHGRIRKKPAVQRQQPLP